MNGSSRIIGRDAELRSITGLLGDPSPRVAALILNGVPGIGKTTIWERGLEEARERGYQILACRPSQAEAALPFVSLADLLDGMIERAGTGLAPLQRQALEAAMLGATRLVEPFERLAVSRAVLTILRELAVPAPMLIAIDDVQWLDASSGHVLAFALRRVGDLPIRVLLSRRFAGEAMPLDLSGQQPRELTVGPLPLEDIDELIVGRLGAQLSRPRLLELHRSSAGNPYFALEIVRALQSRHAPLEVGAALPVPESIDAVLRDRLSALTTATINVLVLAAASAQPTVATIETVMGSTTGLPEALAAGVLALEGMRVHFTHPLLASVVLAIVRPEDLRDVHRRLAEVTVADERAHHLALATDEPDEAIAAELEEVAGLSYARGAPDAAADLADHACRLTPSDLTEERIRRTTRGAEYHLAAGDTARGRDLLEQVAAERAPGPARVDILLRLGQIRYASDDLRAANELHQLAVRESGDDRRARAAAEQALAFTTMVTGDMPGALIHANASLELANEVGEPGLMALALSRVALTEFMVGMGVDHARMEQAVALEGYIPDGPVEWLPSYSYAGIAAYADELERPRDLYATLYRRAAEREDQRALPALLFAMSRLECSAGNWSLARRYAATAVEQSRHSGQAGLLANSLCAQALVDAHIGRADEARAAAEEARSIAHTIGSLPPFAWGTAVLGFLELSLGNPRAAHAHLAPLSEALASTGLGDPGIVGFLSDEIESLIELGEFHAARRHLLALEERGRALDRASALAAAARCRGLLEAAEGDFDAARASLAEAVAQHARIAHPFEFGRTLLARGTIERRAKRRTEARQALTRALELFDTLGAARWAERAASELARIPGRTTSSGDLTETERRVAELVAGGLSNKEVAGQLFISVRTVEANLSKVYAKLGVRSRTELSRHLADLEGS